MKNNELGEMAGLSLSYLCLVLYIFSSNNVFLYFSLVVIGTSIVARLYDLNDSVVNNWKEKKVIE